jgi:flagellar motor switch protein FliG
MGLSIFKKNKGKKAETPQQDIPEIQPELKKTDEDFNPADSFLNDKNGTERAAYLLMSLPKDEASKVIIHLDDESVQKVIREIASIQKISVSEKTEVLKYFQYSIREDMDNFPGSIGGIETIEEILVSAFGETKSKELISKVTSEDSTADFEYLNQIENNILSNLLVSEHPQTIAIALANLAPAKSAAILKSLPEKLQKDVAIRLARTTQIHPEAVAHLATVLKKKLENLKQDELYQQGGVDSLATILSHLDRTVEENILKELDEADPNLVQELKEKLFTFEELADLSIRELRLIINDVPYDQIISKALRGAGEEIRRAFFAAMSHNRASDIIEEINYMGPTPIREINEARKHILEIAQRLDEINEIILKKDREEYV